jgi:4-alpha-glucanotransferase
MGDVRFLVEWMRRAGLSVLQLLPLSEAPPLETSPYSSMSAMALDPQFISLRHLEDHLALGGEMGLPAELRSRLQDVRKSPTLDYSSVRSLKRDALRSAFERFYEMEWRKGTERASALETFAREQSWWLEEYALYRALHAHHGDRPWTAWPDDLKQRNGDVLDAARLHLAVEILYRKYLQWIAHEQWMAVRRATRGVAIFGDLPFMVGRDSADVWVRQSEFLLDTSVGVPPDAFSATGQDWGFPAYRWDVVARGGYQWLSERARRTGDLFDGYRVDHLVGFFRTYVRGRDGSGGEFTPGTEDEQRTLGDAVLKVFRGAGAEIVAEDLGIVPAFVHEVLARQGVPGFKVFRWERQWDAEGQPFVDPAEYPAVSLATTGTHDTEPIVVWWDDAPADERRALLSMPVLRARFSAEGIAEQLRAPMSPMLRDALLESLYAAGSDLLVLPVQDVFGWPDRINRPAIVSPSNWRWRLPWLVDRMTLEPIASEAALRLGTWAMRYGR